jgi:hypothetical protein
MQLFRKRRLARPERAVDPDNHRHKLIEAHSFRWTVMTVRLCSGAVGQLMKAHARATAETALPPYPSIKDIIPAHGKDLGRKACV